METLSYDEKYWSEPCRKVACGKKCQSGGLKFVNIPAVLGDDSSTSDVAPQNGRYCNAIVRYEANGAVYIYSVEGVPVNVKEGTNAT